MKGAIGEACVYSKLECCDTASSLSVCDTGMKNCFVDSPGATMVKPRQKAVT